MLEWLAATTGVELGKLVLEQVLDLSKPVLKGYVQDFFEDCLSNGVSRLNVTALKTPMAEAVGYFIKRFIRELQINGVPETSIQHHYKVAIKKFVQDKAVRPILGKAFEKDCKRIDYGQLNLIWAQHYQGAGWQFPLEEFDWRGVCKEYIYEVRGIAKANPELRSLLETELLEDIARNTAQLSPGFDAETYRNSLQSSYSYLKLYTLNSTDRVDAIKLWAIFIEQSVREALPPMRYELPLDVKRQLQAEGQLEADLSPEALEPYYHEYFQQPVRKVLGAVADSQRTVILGDPGSGKSSLLQYLALEWIEGKTEKLPLLIELREFAINPFANFLEFLHRGRGVDWQFDQQQLHQHLLELPTLVMFDGLDEVFDRTTQLTVIDDIIRFSQQYPKAQVLVTSRIIGYNPDRLQHSGFKHFTIQSLNTGEIHQFIDRWYDLSMGKDPDKMRLKQRLKDAITSSKAIANLADNPLLLTMMAILNRRQELPHDRADLYDQASRVLLYHWDVDHKRLHIPMNTIGRREKQEMLRLIAYEMQVGEEGLKGNLISSDRLTRILTDYLCDQGFSEPREKASLLILQLRERNFILCYRGVDTYGFIHRTFLEYFCAVEIVYRFEKQRTLTFDQLRDEVFGQHCQDETWHEVLRLICNMINAKLANELIDRLMTQKIEKEKFLEIYPGGAKYLRKQGVVNLILAANCLTEIQFNSLTSSTKTNLIKIIQLELKSQNEYILDNETCDELLMGIIKNYHSQEDIRGYLEYCLKLESLVWDGGLMNPLPPSAFRAITKIHSNDSQSDILSWIVRCIQSESNEVIRGEAICELAKNWKKHSETFHLLKKSAQSDSSWHVRYLAIEKLGDNWKNNEETLSIVKEAVEFDEVWQVRFRSMRVLARVWQNDVDTLYFLKQRFKEDNDDAVRSTCIEEVALRWSDDPDTFSFLKTCICCDEYSSWIRAKTISALLDKWIHFSEVFQLCIKVILHDPFVRDEDQGPNPRHIALKGLLTNYPTHPNTIELLRDRAFNDPDGQLQQWAADQLKMRNSEI